MTIKQASIATGLTKNQIQSRLRKLNINLEKDSNGKSIFPESLLDTILNAVTPEQPQADHTPPPDHTALINALQAQVSAQQQTIAFLQRQLEQQTTALLREQGITALLQDKNKEPTQEHTPEPNQRFNFFRRRKEK